LPSRKPRGRGAEFDQEILSVSPDKGGEIEAHEKRGLGSTKPKESKPASGSCWDECSKWSGSGKKARGKIQRPSFSSTKIDEDVRLRRNASRVKRGAVLNRADIFHNGKTNAFGSMGIEARCALLLRTREILVVILNPDCDVESQKMRRQTGPPRTGVLWRGDPRVAQRSANRRRVRIGDGSWRGVDESDRKIRRDPCRNKF